MIERPVWVQRLQAAWDKRPVVWLSGVRRVGKTTLSRMLADARHLNCDLPSVQRSLADPELYFDGLDRGSTVVFDEVHRLPDPSQVLKIAADEYPGLKVLATGSSTLAATGKFRDALTGRKLEIHLCPIPWEECLDSFGVADLDRRLLNGGLPEALLDPKRAPEFYSEWIDSFYARDILELFNIRRREGFLALLRLLLRRSGGQVDYTSLASLTELSRLTVRAHVDAMVAAHVVRLIKPFHGGSKQEIVSRPKCYAFDTGFVAFGRGWEQIRDEDRGILWEHLVLDSLLMRFHENDVLYWQDKSRREVDFVIHRPEGAVDTVECKVNPDRLNPGPVEVFRRIYPKGANYIVTPLDREPYRMRRGELVFTACSTRHLK